MGILLSFNNEDIISYEDLQSITQLSSTVLKPTLIVISIKKNRISYVFLLNFLIFFFSLSINPKSWKWTPKMKILNLIIDLV